MPRLTRLFYTRPALTVAKEMLGKFLVHRLPGGALFRGKIVETEAYPGPQDRASHAFGGKHTARNQAEWLVGGHVYIYLVYGMYWQLNISTGAADFPECVLIRALEPDTGLRLKVEGLKLANGPGKLCRWMKLDKSFYGEDLTKSRRLWIGERGVQVPRSQIVSAPRVGIDYAGSYWAKKPWRFYIKNNPAVSQSR